MAVTTYFQVGYAVFLIVSERSAGMSIADESQPSQVIITRVKPHLWLPSLELAWGLITIGLSQVSNAKQM